MDTMIKLDLQEVGTRYDHYMELRDAFATGIEVMVHALEIHKSVSDLQRLEKLKSTVELINSRVNYLADYDKKMAPYGDIAKEVKAIGIHRTMQLAEVSESTRLACEQELTEAAKTGYELPGGSDAKDSGPKNTPTDKGTSTN